MAIDFNVADLFKDIDKLIDVAAATAAGTNREKEKKILSAVVEKMRMARNDAAEILPKALEGLKAQAEANLATAEKAQAEIEKAQKEVEAMLAAAVETQAAKAAGKPATPATQTPAAPEIDPGLGVRLRNELLGTVGVPTDAGPGPAAPGKDIWEDWK